MEELSVECVETLHEGTYSATIVGIQKVLIVQVEATVRVSVRRSGRMPPSAWHRSGTTMALFRVGDMRASDA